MDETTEDGPSFSTLIVELLDRLWSTDYVANLVEKTKLGHMLLRRLETILCAIEEVLHDAEHQQMENAAVKKWLDYIKDAVNVADGLLNQIATKTEPSEEVSNLKDIVHKLESIFEHKDLLGLQHKHITRENSSRNTPTSLAEGCNIYGRDKDKEAMIKLLLDDSSDDNISVISIVGMGGIGKTTLAQMVYNDDNLKQKFDLKAWVCVGEEFDILKITQTIIEAVTSNTCTIKDLNLLELALKGMVSKKKFLFVLDEILNEDYHSWDILFRLFQYGMKGSKILITTRSKSVARLAEHFIELQPLSVEDCWLMFAERSSISSISVTLENIGRQIVLQCGGNPLAVQLVGGLLQTKHNINDWHTILNSYDRKFSEDRSAIFPTLTICYHYLPAHLKRCFVSCSSYPYNYMFSKDELISFWMARGLLQSLNSEKTSEEIGDEYFHDLVSRSFLQQFSIDGSCKSFVMHNLIHDLASIKANELRTFLPLYIEDLSTTIPSMSRDTGWIQIHPLPPFTLPTISKTLSIFQHQWMISIRIRNVRLRVELWRLMGLVSGIIGMFCLALSPSFTHLIRGWDSFKFFLYGVVIFIICITTMFAKKPTYSRPGMLKAIVGFTVLILTSLYSFWHDKAMNGKADLWSTISNGAFALMSLSLSRVLKLGFEAGLFAFFLGSFVVQLATIKLVLIPVGIMYGLPLFLIHTYSNADSDYLPSVRTLDD